MISQVTREVCPMPFSVEDLTPFYYVVYDILQRYMCKYLHPLEIIHVCIEWRVMYRVPLRRALTPVYKGEITSRAISHIFGI